MDLDLQQDQGYQRFQDYQMVQCLHVDLEDPVDLGLLLILQLLIDLCFLQGLEVQLDLVVLGLHLVQVIQLDHLDQQDQLVQVVQNLPSIPVFQVGQMDLRGQVDRLVQYLLLVQ